MSFTWLELYTFHFSDLLYFLFIQINFGIVILLQRHEGRLYPIAFHSRIFTETEINYDTADQELLAIVDCFKGWRRFQEGAKHQLYVILDHQNQELI